MNRQFSENYTQEPIGTTTRELKFAFSNKGKAIKPHDRLVLVSSMPHGTYTSNLSNGWSARGLQGACAPGNIILG